MDVYDRALKHSALKKHKNIKLIVNFLVKNKVKVLLSLILILGSILRFYDFFNRWGLAYDQARDLIVASYALHNFTIPLILDRFHLPGRLFTDLNGFGY